MDSLTARLVPSGAIWESLPLELLVSALAVILAGGLSAAGVMP